MAWVMPWWSSTASPACSTPGSFNPASATMAAAASTRESSDDFAADATADAFAPSTSMSFTVGTGSPVDSALIPAPMRLTVRIAASDDGTARVKRGSQKMIAIVSATRASMSARRVPVR